MGIFKEDKAGGKAGKSTAFQIPIFLPNSKAVYKAWRGWKLPLLLTPGHPWSLWQMVWGLVVALGCHRGEM